MLIFVFCYLILQRDALKAREQKEVVEKKYNKSEDDLKALQSVGQVRQPIKTINFIVIKKVCRPVFLVL